jgi:hypothetical protein
MNTLKDIEIKEISESIFKSFIKKREMEKKLNAMEFNWYSRIQKLKEREIENLIEFENLMSNASKCHRLIEVYNGMIKNANAQNYFANLQWYKNFQRFKQDYLYEFSKTDKLNNEWILRQLVIDKEFLENYNIVLKERGLKIILAKDSRLSSNDIKDVKYKKYINQLMPFVVTLSEENTKRNVATLKITNGTILQLEKDLLEKIIQADTEEQIKENEKLILSILEDKERKENKNLNNTEDNSEDDEKVKFNKYNVIINLYDLEDILLFGEFDKLDTVTNPSRRELDRLKKILNKKNLMALINNSIVIDNTNEDVKLEINENRLRIANDFKDNMKNFFLEVKKSEEEDYMERITKILKNATQEEVYKFFEEEININFTNKMYNLGVTERVILDEKGNFSHKHFVYLEINKNLRNKFVFNSNVELLFIKDIIDKQTLEPKDNLMFYQTNIIYKELQKFFYKNISLFPLNTIDFIIAFLHFTFISTNMLKKKIQGETENNEITLKEEVNKLKIILKPKEFDIFLQLMNVISSFTEEYDKTKEMNENIDSIDFVKRIKLEKNEKNRNSFFKTSRIDFKDFFINVIKLQDIFFDLFDDDFFNKEKESPKTLEEYSRKNSNIAKFIYRFFMVFTIDTYTKCPHNREVDYINKEKDYYSVVLKKLSNLRNHIKSTDIIKEDIIHKLKKEEEIKNVVTDYKYVINPFLDFDYSIFNKTNISSTENQFNIVKEINNFLKTIPNISEKEFLFEFKKVLKKNFQIDEVEKEIIDKALQHLSEVSLFKLNLKKKQLIGRKEIIRTEEIEINKETNEEIKNIKEKEVIVFDTIEENFYFENIYDICYYIYLQTLVFANILRNSSKGELGLHLLGMYNEYNFEYDIVFTDELKLRRILNLVELSKILFKKIGLISDASLDELNIKISEHFEDIKRNVIVDKQIEFRDKLLEIVNNPLSPFNNYISFKSVEENGTITNYFKSVDLFLIPTKLLEFFRFSLCMRNLSFNYTKEFDTIEFEVSTSEKEKKSKSSSSSLLIDNNFELYKYSSIYSKNYKELKEQIENETQKDYYKYMEEFIKANKNLAFINNFIEQMSSKLEELDIPNSIFPVFFDYQ